jgi:hypothetical protein
MDIPGDMGGPGPEPDPGSSPADGNDPSRHRTYRADCVVVIGYTNWRGVRAERLVVPWEPPYWGSDQWHPRPQWLWPMLDVEKDVIRTFALSGIDSWRAASEAERSPA